MSFLRERMTDALTTETMRRRHLRRVMEIEEGLYPRPWTHRTFVTEISLMREGARYYLVAYVGDVLVGYGGLMFSGDGRLPTSNAHECRDSHLLPLRHGQRTFRFPESSKCPTT